MWCDENGRSFTFYKSGICVIKKWSDKSFSVFFFVLFVQVIFICFYIKTNSLELSESFQQIGATSTVQAYVCVSTLRYKQKDSKSI